MAELAAPERPHSTLAEPRAVLPWDYEGVAGLHGKPHKPARLAVRLAAGDDVDEDRRGSQL